MSLKILIDMNLSPHWREVFQRAGISSVHWSDVGDPKASDHVLMEWAKDNDHIIFTHDLDFGTILALTQARSPSVIQVRGQNILPEHIDKIVIHAVKQYEVQLKRGAIIVLDQRIKKTRILPLIQ
jgi:predicted nuclease of predicted toxin-antitoxin system